jgi:hypothetical protein
VLSPGKGRKTLAQRRKPWEPLKAKQFPAREAGVRASERRTRRRPPLLGDHLGPGGYKNKNHQEYYFFFFADAFSVAGFDSLDFSALSPDFAAPSLEVSFDDGELPFPA